MKMKKEHLHIVEQIAPGSIAQELEIEPGDAVAAINGNVIEDIFDYQYYTQDFLRLIRNMTRIWELRLQTV